MMNVATDFDHFVQCLRESFFALRRLSEALLAPFECTPGERGLLQDLERLGPQTVPSLAQTRSVARQTMQKIVDRLVQRGWLALVANPRHQRSWLVAVSPAGRQLFDRMRARELELLSSVTLPVPVSELRRATKTLDALSHFFSTLDVPRQATSTRKRAS